MSPELDFELHPEATKDITEIWEYIAADRPLTAKRVREEILFAGWCPSQSRDTGDRISHSRPLRFQTVRDYLTAYAPDVKPLLVVAALHGRRNPRGMAPVLPSPA